MAADPILDLSTLIADRPAIRIDGQTFHLKSPDEMTLAESFQFSRWGKQLDELGAAERIDDVQALLPTVCRAALADVPEDVQARLSASQRMAIAEVFTALLLARQAQLAGAVDSAVRSIGQRSSRASSGSLAATPAGGSTTRRPRSFEHT